MSNKRAGSATANDLRALILDHSAGLGGAQLALVDLVSFAPKQFYTVLLEDGPLRSRLAAVGSDCEVLRVPEINGSLVGSGGWRYVPRLLSVALRLRKALRKLVDDKACSVLVLNSLRALLLVGICGSPKGLRCVVFMQDGLSRRYLSLLKLTAIRLALRRVSDLAIANSRWTQSLLPAKISSVSIPSMSGRAFFESSLPTIRSTDDSKFVKVLLLGRMVEWKGQLHVLNNLKYVNAKTEWSLTLAGGPWFGEERYFNHIKVLADSITQPRVRVVGHIDDVMALVDEHDIVLHASTIPEPFGQVVVQAMARGKPAVVACAGGAAEFVQQGACRGFNPDDPIELTTELAALIDNPAARLELGQQAATASKKYDSRQLQLQLRTCIFALPSRSVVE